MTERNALANAKVNLNLIVQSPASDGYHPIRSLAISVDMADRLAMAISEEDLFECSAEDLNHEGNLAWRALVAYRNRSLTHRPIALRLDKRLPIAAGLGGGSADAAAALVLAKEYFSADLDAEVEIAADLGSDIVFCLQGGFAMLEGRGNDVKPIEPLPEDFALGVATPPFELSTGAVYRKWDELGEPEGPAIGGDALPPSMRDYPPLRNDLYPAAVAMEPGIAEWRDMVERTWSRPVFMTGSGPSLAAYFIDRDEANAAAASAPSGHRGSFAAEPVGSGVVLV
ncbi:MAG: 4-(cytidine 5'-diphospho)-2-C-methyl-D-erythritol kinase [Acidimicrobiia bacterium]|nr:4-(cytidine 5'-diphospho)-2-C-methyl-D-erythritol kinase [Acidimicrobiia bacterium]